LGDIKRFGIQSGVGGTHHGWFSFLNSGKLKRFNGREATLFIPLNGRNITPILTFYQQNFSTR